MMKKHKHNADSGFSLLEVVVAIVIVTFFTTVTMQMIVISAAFKAKAKEYTTATNLIEKDLEVIRSKAAEYEFTTPSVNPIPTPTIIPLPSVNDFNTNDEVQFEGASDVYKITAKNTAVSPPTITITPGIISQPSSSSNLINNTLCNPTSTATSDQGLAERLRLKTATNLSTQQITSGGLTYTAVSGYAPYTIQNTQKKLWLMRNDTNRNTLPYDVLQIRYLVVKPKTNGDPDPNKRVAQLFSEVIPNASFQCLKQ